MENVVLVDEQDRYVGAMEKLQAHVEGRLHRAISVFIFSSDNRLLLQQRAAGKYHSPLLWTNTCCGHPRPGETPLAAAHRRLAEEMGMTCQLVHAFSYTYRADVGDGLTEHEYDHIFTGICDAEPVPSTEEAAAWKYMPQDELMASVAAEPGLYTPWFKIFLADKGELLFNRNHHENIHAQ